MTNTKTFLEKFEPKTLNEVAGQINIVKILRGYIKAGNIPHLMFAGSPGIGKTTITKIIAKELFGDNWESNTIMMNASDERGIDVVRNKIKQATKFAPLNAEFKIIFLDEFDEMCLVKGTKVITGFNTGKKLYNIEDIPQDRYISICSLNLNTNEIESDKGICIDTGISDIYEITLDDGRTIKCTAKHPFFIIDKSGNIIEKPLHDLSEDDEIVDFSDELVNQCEVCGIYTTNKKFCCVDCKDIGHSKQMSGKGNSMYGKNAWNKNKTKNDDDRISKQGIHGDLNPSKRSEVKIKVKDSLRKFYNTESGKKVRIETGQKISKSICRHHIAYDFKRPEALTVYITKSLHGLIHHPPGIGIHVHGYSLID
jgi:replication factor C small subunit